MQSPPEALRYEQIPVTTSSLPRSPLAFVLVRKTLRGTKLRAARPRIRYNLLVGRRDR